MTVEITLGRDDAASVSKSADGSWEIHPDLSYMRLAIVNVVYYGQPSSDQPWVLIDTGLGTSSPSIEKCAQERFGGRPPHAIVLTHGHFDHVGAAAVLLRKWDCPNRTPAAVGKRPAFVTDVLGAIMDQAATRRRS